MVARKTEFIHPDTVVGTIDIKALPCSKEQVTLPDGIGTVSQEQVVKIMLPYMQRNFGALTFADALTQMRARFLRGAQHDFGMATSITNLWSVFHVVGVLAGTIVTDDDAFQARLALVNPKLLAKWADDLELAEGDPTAVSGVLRHIENRIGKVPRGVKSTTTPETPDSKSEAKVEGDGAF